MKEVVSVILPVYNVEKYIRKCLDSVVNQTYRNLEIICVDDCGQDNSMDIVKKYAEKDNRIVILSNGSNKGLSVARNEGLKVAKGKFVYFIDSDDWIENNAIDVLVRIASNYNSDIVLFEANMVDENGNILDKRVRNDIREGCYSGIDLFIRMMKHNCYLTEVPYAFFRRKYLIDNKIIFKPGILYEDDLFSYEILCSSINVYCTKYVFYNYVIHNNSIMNSKVTDYNINSILFLIDEFEVYYNECSDSSHKEALEKLMTDLWGILTDRLNDYYYTNKDLYLINSKCRTRVVKKQFEMLQRMKQIELMSNKLTYPELIKLCGYKTIVIYGAGKIGKKILSEILNSSYSGEIIIAVSNLEKEQEVNKFGFRICQIDKLQINKDETIVIIAGGKNIKQEMNDMAIGLGYKTYLL